MVNIQPEYKIVQCTSCGEIVKPRERHFCTVTVGSNPVPLSDLEKALDSLIMADAPPPLADDDITVTRLASRAKCGPGKAKRMITAWVTAGKVVYVGLRREERGHSIKAWRLAK